MKVVNPTNTSHSIKVVPRFNYTTSITFNLYNENTQENEDVSNSSYREDGFLNISFDYTFTEGDRFQIKITDTENSVVYRGKLFATSQETQNYQLTKDLFYYE